MTSPPEGARLPSGRPQQRWQVETVEESEVLARGRPRRHCGRYAADSQSGDHPPWTSLSLRVDQGRLRRAITEQYAVVAANPGLGVHFLSRRPLAQMSDFAERLTERLI